MPLYNLLKRRLEDGFRITTRQELTGTILGVETAFDSAGAYITWPANTLQDGDEIHIEAWFNCTGVGGATNFLPRLYWGGKASGVSMCPATTVAVNTANDVVLTAKVEYLTVGGSPIWQGWGRYTTPANTTYNGESLLFAQVGQPTDAGILLQGSLAFSGGSPNANDKVVLARLRARLERPIGNV